MARRRKTYYGLPTIAQLSSQRRPIKIPQPVKRPLDIHVRDLFDDEAAHPDRWWMTVHRRGPRRTNLGGDPRELRAIPKEKRRGTLPERIILKWLKEVARQVEGADFSFQSSLLGGRLELGGIVADFLFPIRKIVLNPAGPTHDQFLRMRKDDEQTSLLEALGYTQYIIDDDLVYNEFLFEDRMRQILNLGPYSGGGVYGSFSHATTQENNERVLQRLNQAAVLLNSFTFINTGLPVRL